MIDQNKIAIDQTISPDRLAFATKRGFMQGKILRVYGRNVSAVRKRSD
jgi:hypothetical protein